MTPSPFTLPRSEFNEFLFALIGKESNGMPLSVVSALARLEMDPWQEAARLASLPKELAAPALDRLISRLPAGSWDRSETRMIAARLIELLPRRSVRALRADPQPGTRRKAIPAAILWLVVAAIAALLLLLGLAMAAPAADAAPVVPQTLEFDIAHEGHIVGHHRISFRREGDRLIVHSELKIEVAVLFLIVYRYQQSRDEVWWNGKLIALTSTADDDGTPHDIKGQAGPDGLRMSSGAERWTLPPDSVPASFWNVSMVTQKGPLVDSLTGHILNNRVVTLGQETVRAGGRDILATHYRLEAKRPRDVWYDAGGRWVKMSATARDGSIAEWMLK